MKKNDIYNSIKLLCIAYIFTVISGTVIFLSLLGYKIHIKTNPNSTTNSLETVEVVIAKKLNRYFFTSH